MIPCSDIIAIRDDLGLGGIPFAWSIWAVSGSDSVEAYNGPFELTITRPLAVEDNRHLPQMFALHQNFPNPFNPVTTLRYEMPAHTRVTLTIYDTRGRKVIRLVDGYMHAGYNRVIRNRADASGRPGPPGKSASPEKRNLPARRQVLPGVCPGVNSARTRIAPAVRSAPSARGGSI